MAFFHFSPPLPPKKNLDPPLNIEILISVFSSAVVHDCAKEENIVSLASVDTY